MVEIGNLKSGITTALASNPILTTAGAAVAGVAVGLGTAAAIGAVKRRKTKRRKTRSSRKRSSSRRSRKKRYKYARTAGKGKDRSSRRIRMTKTGQPYIILASGKARFIKKSSARRSRKLKGGRY